MTGRVVHLTVPSGAGPAAEPPEGEPQAVSTREKDLLAAVSARAAVRGGTSDRTDPQTRDKAPVVLRRRVWRGHGALGPAGFVHAGWRRGRRGVRHAHFEEPAPATEASTTRRPRCCGAGSRHAA